MRATLLHRLIPMVQVGPRIPWSTLCSTEPTLWSALYTSESVKGARRPINLI